MPRRLSVPFNYLLLVASVVTVAAIALYPPLAAKGPVLDSAVTTTLPAGQ